MRPPAPSAPHSALARSASWWAFGLVAACAGLMALTTGPIGAQSLDATPFAAAVPSSEVEPRWSELSSAQRDLLAPIEREWPRMDDRSKQKWLRVAARLATVGPEERARIQARMTEWANLSPLQRSQMRLRYQEARQVAPKSRQDRWAAYQALPPEEREKLAARGNHASHAASAASGGDRSRARSANGAVVTRKPVSPSVVQAQPGATTSLMSRGTTPPPHVRPGMPRIMASPSLVDSVTLLPKRQLAAPAAQGLPRGMSPAVPSAASPLPASSPPGPPKSVDAEPQPARE